ncbi:nucleotidyltransferase domain-containing protein [Vibrio rhizosphaerae]|uniref:Nucleotidyltransferase domain-containing protein n=1 Tax=Vibrio rhizosphaerae TaxID=398736 RepID=A0ABU4IT39_9VIBR|nr:nucleotidyltransferase domain-containing protein [Vibrio rhizosphaerae]MDW6092444.1 nucleotidyltransferase domain-containing protein [Vibrio rhizosphaerae]
MKTSLDHLPESKQQELATISTILRDTLEDYLQGKTASKSEFRIVKIILFGSHAKGSWVNDSQNGYISDYDILVIVNEAAMVEAISFSPTSIDGTFFRLHATDLHQLFT